MKIVIPLTFVGPNFIFSKSNPEISFGVIADPQYADQDTRGTRFYRGSLEKLDLAIKELNKEKLDFVVTLGDIIDKDISSFSDILPIYNNLKVPHNIVLGNHDFDVADEDKGKILETLKLKKNYYSDVRSGWRFIFLDGTEVSTFRFPEGSTERENASKILEKLVQKNIPQAQPWNGGMSETQMTWLKKELDTAKKSKERVIISNHYPVMPANDGHNLWNAEELVSLLDQYNNVILYMNGHNHKGNYAVKNGTHYVNFKGMVETEKETAYATVECYSDRVEIKGYGLEPDRIVK